MASLYPLWIIEFVTNLLIMVISVYAITTSRRMVKSHPNVSLWIYLQWQVIALGIFAFSHATGHIVKRILLLGDREALWEVISPFSGGLNSMAFVVVGILTFLYKDLKMASEKYEELEEAKALLLESGRKLQESYRKLEEDSAVITEQYQKLIDTNDDLEEAYKRLMEANDTLTSFFEAIPDGVFMVDSDMIVKEMNARAKDFLPNLFLGKGCREMAGGGHSNFCVDCVIAKTFEDGEPHLMEAAVALPSGENRHIKNISFPIKDNKGKVVLAISILRDVTERVEMTERLLRQNEELKVLDQAKSNFIDIASHELRTPLSSIVGYVDLLMEDPHGEADTEFRSMLESVQRSSSRLREIIDDLLDVARIESGKLSFDRKPMKLRRIIDGVLAELEPMYTGRGHNVTVEYSDDRLEVEADFYRMNQVFYNLISNAIKFTPDGGRISVRAESVETGPGSPIYSKVLRSFGPDIPAFMEHVVVTDTGIGVPRADLERIFERFYEVGDVSQHSSGKSKFMGGGTGLGLSIAKGIVEGHGGRIWAESEGRDHRRCPGTTIHVLLPVAGGISVTRPTEQEAETAAATAEAETVQAAPEQAGEPAAVPAVDGVKPMVLLIEDDPDITLFTRRVLEKSYQVSVAEDGMEGIKKAFDLKPDAILLDIWMSGLDGYEVCKIMKANPALKDIPVAFFTASAQKSEIERGYSSGADDYIIKPFSASELQERVARLVSGNKEMAAGRKGA